MSNLSVTYIMKDSYLLQLFLHERTTTAFIIQTLPFIPFTFFLLLETLLAINIMEEEWAKIKIIREALLYWFNIGLAESFRLKFPIFLLPNDAFVHWAITFSDTI